MNFKRALRVWQRNATVYKKLYRSSIALNFFEPMFYFLALGIGLGGFIKEINGLTYLQFIAPGIVMSSAMYAACYECTYGTYVRMEYQKTFDAILATPILFEEVIMGELLWGTTKSLIYGTIILIVMLFFGLVNNFEVLLLLFYLIFCGLIFSSLSLIATALVPGIESFNYFYTLFLTPLFLFSGIFFPLEEMPSLLKSVFQFNPLFHLVNISRTLFYVGINGFVLYESIYLLLFLLFIMPLPFLLLKRRYLL